MEPEVQTQTTRTRDTSAATAASVAARKKKAEERDYGRQSDKKLLPEIEALLAHATNVYAENDLTTVRLFIDMAKEFHRGVNWRKKSIQALEREQIRKEVEPESDERFEDQEHLYFFVDAWINEMIGLARSVHLSPELTSFWIETLERATKWFQANPENLEWQDEIAAELERRRRGEDTYSDPSRRPVGRPPKVPKAPEVFKPEQQYV